jgi:hypothetical protein
MPSGILPEDFWDLVDSRNPNGCWIWTGYCHQGYGRLWVPERQQSFNVHRLAYEERIGPVPSDLELDHLCRKRACCNPAHLEPVTHQENVLRGVSPAAQNARKTHCPQGHPYAGKNLYVKPNGKRICRICHRVALRAASERKRAFRVS